MPLSSWTHRSVVSRVPTVSSLIAASVRRTARGTDRALCVVGYGVIPPHALFANQRALQQAEHAAILAVCLIDLGTECVPFLTIHAAVRMLRGFFQRGLGALVGHGGVDARGAGARQIRVAFRVAQNVFALPYHLRPDRLVTHGLAPPQRQHAACAA